MGKQGGATRGLSRRGSPTPTPPLGPSSLGKKGEDFRGCFPQVGKSSVVQRDLDLLGTSGMEVGVGNGGVIEGSCNDLTCWGIDAGGVGGELFQGAKAMNQHLPPNSSNTSGATPEEQGGGDGGGGGGYSNGVKTRTRPLGWGGGYSEGAKVIIQHPPPSPNTSGTEW